MQIEIVAHADAAAANPARFASVPPEHAIRGFFGVTLLEQNAPLTAAILNVMGFQKIGEAGNRLRFSAPGRALETTSIYSLIPRRSSDVWEPAQCIILPFAPGTTPHSVSGVR